MGRVTSVRVPQEERSRAMRARLMDATIECLVEYGFGGTSSTLISDRAGVSRGAQLHHFPTKNDLVVAAVEHLTEVRGAELAAAAAVVPVGPRRTRDVLRMLGDHFASPVFTAALELWVAARTDHQLLAAVGPLEQRIGRETHRLTVELLGADESAPGGWGGAGGTGRRGARGSWCRRRSPWSAGWAWPTRSPTTPAGAAGSSTG